MNEIESCNIKSKLSYNNWSKFEVWSKHVHTTLKNISSLLNLKKLAYSFNIYRIFSVCSRGYRNGELLFKRKMTFSENVY